MHLPHFEYVAPRTVARAVSIQKKSGKFLAGGTDLLVAMKGRIASADLLVDLNSISGLKGIKWDKKEGLQVGALTTLADLRESPVVRERFPSLSQTVSLVGAPQLQNMGTLGGNLCLDTRCYYYNQSAFLKKRWEPCFKIGGKTCHVVKKGDTCYAVYSGDMAIPLIALGARVMVKGSGRAKEMEVRRFFTGSGLKPNILKFNEIVTGVLIPPLPEQAGLSYQKLRLRDTMDFSLMGIAVFLQLEGMNGRCRDVRIVLGGLGPSPLVVEGAPKLMCGKSITSKLIDEVSGIARKMARPVDNTASSPRYRREMIPVFTKKAFEEALQVIKNGQT
jgi:4-hydroxybenzoyl-CoA reductase subunit beta